MYDKCNVTKMFQIYNVRLPKYREKKNEDSVDTCNQCLELEAELVKKNNVYIELLKRKLKETIYSLRENVNPVKVKHDIDEIKTINIELEHSVAKLLSENEKIHKEKEHLKKTYKELYDSIKPTRIHAKEQCDALIVNLNSKSMENAYLKAQIQEKVFANAALKNELKKLKGKIVIDTVVSKPHATTIALGMFKLDLEPLALKSRKNKKNRVAKTECNAYVMQSMLNVNSKSLCAIYNECLFDANHDKCVLDYVHDVNVLSKSKSVKRKNKNEAVWNVTISRVYYIEGLGYNLFSVGQFCDSDLEVAFRKHTCFVHNLEGDDLLMGSRGTNLYTLSIGDMMKSSLIYLLSKAS
ncbi:hypothetical protein Tco_0117522 [Tanacetum coccineum]